LSRKRPSQPHTEWKPFRATDSSANTFITFTVQGNLNLDFGLLGEADFLDSSTSSSPGANNASDSWESQARASLRGLALIHFSGTLMMETLKNLLSGSGCSPQFLDDHRSRVTGELNCL
jgi:hypothetical protein